MQRFSDYPLVLTAAQVAEILNVSQSTAYAYMQLKDFPSFKLPGKRGTVRVLRDAFQAWMMEKGASA